MFSSYLYADEAQRVDALLKSLPWDDVRKKRIEKAAIDLIVRVRGAKRKMGELETFLQQYGLQSEEGLALMTLAEALLRIPDAETAMLLIRDKMAAAEWLGQQGSSKDLLVKAAGFGLSLTRKTLDSAFSKMGEPVIRKAMVEAMRMLGKQFVLGRSIEEAIDNGGAYRKKGYRMSYDMLGEGARTAEDAKRYFESYAHAINAIGKSLGNTQTRCGVSVKLSALYPRYEFRHAERCVPAMTQHLMELSRLAANHNIGLTVDAEEVDRLELSLQIIEAVAKDSALKNWDGFGLAIQAYQKRCLPLTEHLVDLARTNNRRMQIRLVKGAYWDTEVKRAQVMGLLEYPVYTRKTNTDLSYLACARVLLEARDAVYPMLATHNAHSIAAVLDLAGNDRSGFEFQRLHGMGETLHDLVLNDGSAKACVYAPCGSHEDLLPYLVRRLLENGANSSFVNKLLDPATPPETLCVDPVENAKAHKLKRHPRIALPKNIYGERINSAGLDLTDTPTFQKLHDQIKSLDAVEYEAAPLIGGNVDKTGTVQDVKNPATGDLVGKVWNASSDQVSRAFETTRKGFAAWNAAPADVRGAALEKFADLMEKHRAELMGLCVREAGKTLEDAQAEIREAVDFCRYYAQQGRKEFDANGMTLPGPTGERNVMTLHGRGVFVCISPWNFPLAIFVGQIVAAMMAGNAVIAKPAEQTPIVGFRAVQLMIEAGVPAEAIALLTGDGTVGAQIVQHPDVAGVAFTGSTDVARIINRTLAAKDSAIVPLIAETGGQNAMIVDSSALPEQIVDDVMTSAFGSTGQRCSALRVLYVQDDIAERVITLLKGAMAERTVGNPINLATDIGPVIDGEALKILQQHRSKMQTVGKLIAEVPSPEALRASSLSLKGEGQGEGYFFAPVAFEINDIKQLEREVFGPVLHVIRFKASDIDRVIADVNATGYGLTFGAHTRISTTMKKLAGAANAGNVYINRTMIGAVVGVQPFGGQGLSGTGPKAGGHHYLHRFATEKVVSTDTTRQGGNATLVSLEE